MGFMGFSMRNALNRVVFIRFSMINPLSMKVPSAAISWSEHCCVVCISRQFVAPMAAVCISQHQNHQVRHTFSPPSKKWCSRRVFFKRGWPPMLIKRRDQPKVEANKFLDCGCWSIWGGLTIWTSHYIGTSTSRRPSWIFLQTPRTPQPRRSISGTSKVGNIIDPKEGFWVSGHWVRPHIWQLFIGENSEPGDIATLSEETQEGHGMAHPFRTTGGSKWGHPLPTFCRGAWFYCRT